VSIQAELKLLSADLQKSKSVRSVEMNPTMSQQTLRRLSQEIISFSDKNAKSTRVVLVGFVKQ